MQGPPQPPRLEVPERVTGLSVVQLGRTLEFRFALPLLARDGERLTKPQEIEILHAQLRPTESPASHTPWALWVRLQPDQWKPHVTAGTLTYPAPLSADEFTNWQEEDSAFAVRTLTRGFRGRPLESEASNLVPLRLLDVSGPVDHLDSKTSPTAIELEWRPPAQLLDGRPVRLLAGYRVYRSPTGKPGSFQLLAESKDPLYLDGDFEFGHAYSYEVRALFKQAQIVAESEPSQPYEVIPRERFPPARPAGLTAIYTNGAVELVWTANSEKDLAGYYVYRRQKGEPRRKLNDTLLPTPILRDSGVEPGRVYLYQVTAVDLAKNESQPSAEVEVETGN